MEEEEKKAQEVVGRYGHPNSRHNIHVREEEEMKTAVGGTYLNTVHSGDNAVIPFNRIEQSQCGSALDGSHPLMTAVSPSGNLQNLTLGKPYLG